MIPSPIKTKKSDTVRQAVEGLRVIGVVPLQGRFKANPRHSIMCSQIANKLLTMVGTRGETIRS